jgi:hypothetical protein
LDTPEAPEEQPVIAIQPGIARVSPAADRIVNRSARPLSSFTIELFEAMKRYQADDRLALRPWIWILVIAQFTPVIADRRS